MFNWFVILAFATLQCWFLVSWVDTYLFSYLGEDDDGKLLFGFHAMTIPCRIFAFCVGIVSITICVIAWGCFLTEVVL